MQCCRIAGRWQEGCVNGDTFAGPGTVATLHGRFGMYAAVVIVHGSHFIIKIELNANCRHHIYSCATQSSRCDSVKRLYSATVSVTAPIPGWRLGGKRFQ